MSPLRDLRNGMVATGDRPIVPELPPERIDLSFPAMNRVGTVTDVSRTRFGMR
jgi:hypothetical protein